MKTTLFQLCFLVFFISGCSSRKAVSTDDGKIRITFLQVNDVYEISPVEGGNSGGLARVAQVKKELIAENPNTVLVMAGDFLSPSIYNSLKHDGKRIRGAQMVDAMNVAGFDIAVFGNHEFDISEDELQSRLNESQFDWVASNTFHQQGNKTGAFERSAGARIGQPLPATIIRSYTDNDGTTVRIGFIGITLPFNKAGFVSYSDPLSTAKRYFSSLSDSVDAVVAITHQLVDDDSILASQLPGLALIMGGHEHDMRFLKVGNVPVTKAHANAKSAYIINLDIDKRTKTLTSSPQLKMLDQTVGFDSATNVRVQWWSTLAENNFSSLGFNARRVINNNLPPMDGRESELRRRPTNFTRIIVKAMEAATPESDVSIVNSGSIRVDDILPMPITEYDIIRSLPFGGSIVEVDMAGDLLTRILENGEANKGIGGYLHFSEKITKAPQWFINGIAIDSKKIYRVALTDFLLTGGEANMSYLRKDNPSILKVYPVSTSSTDPRSDIRLAIIRFMEKL